MVDPAQQQVTVALAEGGTLTKAAPNTKRQKMATNLIQLSSNVLPALCFGIRVLPKYLAHEERAEGLNIARGLLGFAHVLHQAG